MTRLSDLLHKLVARILLILELPSQVVVMCKEVSSYMQRSKMMKTQSIPIKTLRFHSWSIHDPWILVKHHAQSIISINLQYWVFITPMLPYVLMNTQAHHMMYCHLMYTLTQIWNAHRSKQTSISKLPLDLTCLCVLSFTAHQHVSKKLCILLLLHLMIYLLDRHKAMKLSMMKIVSTHKTLPTRHHLVCCMKTSHLVNLLKILMKHVTKMVVILREFFKSVTIAILKPCMVWFTPKMQFFNSRNLRDVPGSWRTSMSVDGYIKTSQLC